MYVSGDLTAPFDTLRLSSALRKHLLERARSVDHRVDTAHPRQPRIPFDVAEGLQLSVTHPGGSACRFRIYPRELGSTSVSFLHGGFLHAGSRCILHLLSLNRQLRAVSGRVVACRHVEGLAHEVFMEFDQSINVSAFVGDVGLASESNRLSMPLARVMRVLCVHVDQATRSAISNALSAASCMVDSANCATIAAQRLGGRPYDRVFIDMALPDGDPSRLALRCRNAGVRGPIIALYNNPVPDRTGDIPVGFDAVMEAPFEIGCLLGEIAPPAEPELIALSA
ncbi:MAG: hypothetical protein GC162_02245 [Planctomycetes bacterium]|nr:hypothetical protein [Planctomycetota bacterium]